MNNFSDPNIDLGASGRWRREVLVDCVGIVCEEIPYNQLSPDEVASIKDYVARLRIISEARSTPRITGTLNRKSALDYVKS